MWPFKTQQQKIEKIEDDLTRKQTYLACYTAAHEGAESISYFHLDKMADLTAQIAVLRNRLEREKAKA